MAGGIELLSHVGSVLIGVFIRRLARVPAELVHDFVFEDTDEPGPHGSCTRKTRLQHRQQGFLHCILRPMGITQMQQRI